MSALLVIAMLLGEPAPVAVEQLDAAEPAPATAPIEQVSTGTNSAFIDETSRPSDSRDGEVPQLSVSDNEIALGRVEGIDRCSAELLSAQEKAYCDRRIEARSAEFTTQQSAPLSAEQKLLGERLAAGRGTGIEGATRSAASGVSADDRDFQALAAITFQDPPAPAPDAKTGQPSDVSAETQALIDAIVAKLSNPGGN